MGHQIHQMYTARRIQRYEQLYGYRPLKFRIEAFVNGFVDLVRIAFALFGRTPVPTSDSWEIGNVERGGLDLFCHRHLNPIC